jgi:ADP-ribose pyrophosphatase
MEFTPLSSETVYHGRAFDVERIQLRLPDGQQRVYDLVRHNDSVTIVPLDEQGNLLFVNQFRLGVGGTLLELPAGVMDDGEAPDICAAREIREETGMAAGRLELLGDYYLAPGYSSEHMYVYLASNLYADALDQDSDEFLQLVSIPAAQAYEMARGGQIRDSKSLAALLLAAPKLSRWLVD